MLFENNLIPFQKVHYEVQVFWLVPRGRQACCQSLAQDVHISLNSLIFWGLDGKMWRARCGRQEKHSQFYFPFETEKKLINTVLVFWLGQTNSSIYQESCENVLALCSPAADYVTSLPLHASASAASCLDIEIL